MKTHFGRVGVLYGGQSAEREVSLMSGRGVYDALRSLDIDAELFDTGKHSLCELADKKFDRVFIALHGRYGEDGTVQGALELLQLPYTGSGTMASSLAMNKLMTKIVWRQQGLPTPESMALRDSMDTAKVASALGMPVIIKPAHEGSTLGLTRVEREEDLPAAFALATRYDPVALAERFIAGRELTVPVLGSGVDARALPIIEIIAPGGNYDYEHKYLSDATQYVCPADLPAPLAQTIQELSVQAYTSLGCAGWGRADFMLDEAGQPWLLEMNTSPGMTPHSLVPMSAAAAGMSYAQLCLTILSDAACKQHTVPTQG